MAEGFIVSDKTRRAVFEGIASGERDLKRIVRKHRLIRRAAERSLTELKDQNLVRDGDDGLELTDEGEKAAQELRRGSLVG